MPGVPQPKQVEPQRVGYHAEAGKAHGRRAKHGVQRQPQRDKHAGGDGNADGVIEKRPKQIFMDVPQGGPAEPDGGGHIAEPAVDQHHIGGVDGHIRSRADGDAQIRPGEGGGIVDAVAHHGHLSLGLQLPDDGLLALRQDAGHHPVHAGLPADGLCRAGVIAGEHDYGHAHLLQLLHCPGAVLPDHIRHGDEPQQPALPAEIQRCFPFLRQRRAPAGQRLGKRALRAQKGFAAAPEELALPAALQSVSGQSAEALHRLRHELLLLRPPQNGPGQRMLAFAFQSRRQRQQCMGVYALRRDHIRHPGLAAGDGAGLIQRHDLHPAHLLQRGSRFEQDPVFRAQTAAHHDGHRRRQPQRAGAADHQHGNSPGQRIARALPQQQPDRRGDGCNAHHHRDEHAGDPVRRLCDGSLGGGGVGDHADDLGKGGILSHPGGPALQKARLIHRGGRDAVAGPLIHRDALAGEGGFVHGALPLQHHAVHRDALAGADGKEIVLLHLSNGDGDLLPVPQHCGRFGGQLHQAPQSVGGAALGAGLQQLAHGDQRQDHGGGFKIEIHPIGHHRRAVAPDLRRRHGEEGIGAVAKGGGGAQRHQRIHIGCAAPQALKAADEKPLIDDHDGRRQQQLGQAHGYMIVLIKGGQGPAPHHVPHGNIHQRQQKAQRPEQPVLQLRRLMIRQLFLLCRLRLLRRRAALQGSAVARLLHRPDHRLRRGVALHAHGVGQKAHRAALHPRHLAHGLFHPGRAGCAAHARYTILLHASASVHFISFCSVCTSSSITPSSPARISRATQVRIWLASSSLLKALTAAFTAADCTRMSGQ